MVPVFFLLACLVLHASASPSAVSTNADFWKRQTPPSGGIQWEECRGFDERYSCALFEVPLDYARPELGNGQLFVAKFAAQTERVGTLFSNPGGPGGSGVELILGQGETLSNQTGGGYDIVSWDPRGVGQVTIPGPISCFSSAQEYIAYWNDSLVLPTFEVRGNFTDDADVQFFYSQGSDWENRLRGLGEQCLTQRSARFAEYVGTAATVRDMVSLADAIDGPDQPINYWGISYGTVIGNFFVNMFTNRVGRVALDGILDPTTHSAGRTDLAWSNTVESADEAFQGFANGCSMAGSPGCVLADPQVNGGKDIISFSQDIVNLAYDLGKQGLIPPGTSTAVRSIIQQALYTPHRWATFANGTLFQTWQNLTAIAQQEGRGSLGKRSSHGIELAILKRQETFEQSPAPDYTFQAISCGDSVDGGSTTTQMVFDELLRVARQVSGFFAPQFPQPAHECHLWPFRAVERYPGPFNARLPTPMLVVGNTADPSTPFKSAKAVADAFGDSATLVEQRGFGHATLAQKSDCIQSIFLNYFENGQLPSGDSTVCEVDDTQELFSSKGITAATIQNSSGNLSAANDALRKEKKTLLATTITFAVITALLVLVIVGQFILARRDRQRLQAVSVGGTNRSKYYT